MVRVQHISFIHNGRIQKLIPKQPITLPIKTTTKNSHLPAELKVRPYKASPLTAYKCKREKRMLHTKCRCSKCEELVEKWIGDVCLPCYDAAIRSPLLAQIADGVVSLVETNRMWNKVLDSYRFRLSVRVSDWFHYQLMILWVFLQGFSFKKLMLKGKDQ